MPGSVGAVVPRLVYETRAKAAIVWAQRLSADGAPESDVAAALRYSVRFYERAYALAPEDRALAQRLEWLKRVMGPPIDLTRT
jgi:hypothetical protein